MRSPELSTAESCPRFPRRTAAGLLLLVVGVAAGAAAARGRSDLAVFDLDGELNAPAFVSSSVLVAASAAAWTAGRRGRSPSALVLGGLLLIMAADELLELHERLEQALGIDWQLLYAPVVLAGAVAWALLLRSSLVRGARTAAVLLVLAAGAWGGSQLLERLQYDENDQKVDGYYAMMVIEELSELFGSCLFLLAALCLPGRPSPSPLAGDDRAQRPAPG